MPYSEFAQTENTRELPSDEEGFYTWEPRPTQEVLNDLSTQGLDVSGFLDSVSLCRNNLAEDVRHGRIDLNDLESDAEMLALTWFSQQLEGTRVELFRKVYHVSFGTALV